MLSQLTDDVIVMSHAPLLSYHTCAVMPQMMLFQHWRYAYIHMVTLSQPRGCHQALYLGFLLPKTAGEVLGDVMLACFVLVPGVCACLLSLLSRSCDFECVALLGHSCQVFSQVYLYQNSFTYDNRAGCAS